jgi:hypothetical protein
MSNDKGVVVYDHVSENPQEYKLRKRDGFSWAFASKTECGAYPREENNMLQAKMTPAARLPTLFVGWHSVPITGDVTP